jgi:hypothetical protein
LWAAAAMSGFRVNVHDLDCAVLETLRAGRLPFIELGGEEMLGGLLALASLNLTRRDILPTLAATLTTIALDDSSLQRFEAGT